MSIATMLKERSYKKKVKDWPERAGCTLEITLNPPAVNGLKFRGHMDEARILGRPSDITTVGSGPVAMRLDFAHCGLSLEYEDDRLVYVGVIISPADDISSDSGMTPARATLLHGAQVTLSPAVTAEQIVKTIGRPGNIDSDEDEHILTYEIGGYTVEVEFTPRNELKRLNLFPM